MTVWILEAPEVHPAMVLWRHIAGAARLKRLVREIVDPLPAVQGDGGHDFSRPGSIRDRFLGEGSEERLAQQHGENMIAYDNTSAFIIGKLRIDGKSQRLVERHGFLQIPYGKIDEDLLGRSRDHDTPPFLKWPSLNSCLARHEIDNYDLYLRNQAGLAISEPGCSPN